MKGAADWYTGRDVGYTGSGQGHGPRQLVANALGDTIDNADNLGDVLAASLLQEDRVQLTGQALYEIAHDEDLLVFQNELIQRVQKDPEWYSAKPRPDFKRVTFGGDGIIESAPNELTWMVRAADVHVSKLFLDEQGNIEITYWFDNKLDLRPDHERSFLYNLATTCLGYVWHDRWGGNDNMYVRADWSVIISPEEQK